MDEPAHHDQQISVVYTFSTEYFELSSRERGREVGPATGLGSLKIRPANAENFLFHPSHVQLRSPPRGALDGLTQPLLNPPSILVSAPIPASLLAAPPQAAV